MTKQELIEVFYHNHQSLIHYIESLSPQQFMRSRHSKWTAGQQLSHIYLCLKPIAQVLASKDFIQQQFGTLNREVMEYGEVVVHYKRALENGGVAPARFLPDLVTVDQRNQLVADLNILLHAIQNEWQSYTERELNSLVLPHPLLGNLSIREMFYLMAYHATHHQRQIKKSLELQVEVRS